LGYVLAVLNQKGGVGKTTTAVSLSASLAQEGYKTLLIDADPQCNASVSLGLNDTNQEGTLYNLLLDDEKEFDNNKYIVKTCYDNYHIILGSEVLYALDIIFSTKSRREFILRDRIQNYRNYYDFIIMDGPPNLGTLSVNIMTASDSILIPLKADFLSLQGVAVLLDSYHKMKTYLNPNLYLNGVLLNMYNISTNLSKEVEDNILFNLKELVYKTKIPQNIKIAESPSHKQPVIYYDPKCIGSIKYKEFTQEFLERLHNKKLKG
jgi:chromosome partitioning protein